METAINIIIAAVFGIVTIVFCELNTRDIQLCSDFTEETSEPCLWEYPVTQTVCTGEIVSTNVTLNLPQNILDNLTLSSVKVRIGDRDFSHGSHVVGEWHNGDEFVDRWRNKISFEGSTLLYELHNKKVKFKDEFICLFEIDIGREKFITGPIHWFTVVDDCIPPSTNVIPLSTNVIPIVNKLTVDKPKPRVVNDADQLKNITAAINALPSNIAQLLEKDLQASIQKVANSSNPSQDVVLIVPDEKLDTLNKIGYSIIVLLFILAFQSPLSIYLKEKLIEYFTARHHSKDNLDGSSHEMAEDPPSSPDDVNKSQGSPLLHPADEQHEYSRV